MGFDNIANMMATSPLNGAAIGAALGGVKRQSKLGQLANDYANAGDPAARKTAIQNATAFDPETGAGMQAKMEGDQSKAQKVAAQAARYVLTAWKSGGQQAADQAQQAVNPWLAEVGKATGKVPPMTFDQANLPHLEALAAMEGSDPQDNTPSDIRSLQMLQNDPKLMALAKDKASWGAEGRMSLSTMNTPEGGTIPVWTNPVTREVRAMDGRVLFPGEGQQAPAQGGQPQAANQQPISGSGGAVLDDALFAAQEHAESRGNQNAVSPKGAFGVMQIMPETARSPGFGMQPLRAGASEQENRAFGQEYMTKMAGRYNGNVRAGLAAYNWGPGNFDNALASAGGDVELALSRAPKETRDYVAKITGQAGARQAGGQVAQAGGLDYTKLPGYTKKKGVEITPYQAAQIERQDKQDAEKSANTNKANQRADELLKIAKAKAAQTSGASGSDPKLDTARRGLAGDAINFAAAYIGKSPEEVGKMTPEAIRAAMKDSKRKMTGPILGRLPGVGSLANADLEAYSNSAAGKQARLNNPTGPVSNADFDIGRKSVWSAEKPDSVNADLVYQALTWGRRNGGASAPKPAPKAPKSDDVTDLLEKYK